MSPAPVEAETRGGLPARHRLVWVDVARGLALVSMMIAHTAPSGGPAGVLNLSEFLTAALFAALVGVGSALERRRYGAGRTLVLAAVRALALWAAAFLADLFGAQVVDILRHLALVTLAMGVFGALPRVGRAVLALVGVALGVWLTALGTVTVAAHLSAGLAPLQEATAPIRAQLGNVGAALEITDPEVLMWTASYLTAGPYRLPLLLAWALLGSVLVASVVRFEGVARVTAVAWAGAGLLVAGAGLAWSRWHIGEFPTPYTASLADVAVTGGLVVLALGLCAAVVPAHLPWLTDPLAVAGSMTLSVYVAHQAYLGWAVGGWTVFGGALQPGPGPWVNAAGTDDTWFNLVVLIVAAVLLPLLWRRLVRARPWQRGPLEGVVGLVTGRIAR
ncbi:hypothetical protein [Micrococcus sp.]|uniref:hypothetical protein n=1 Tax=Micrococcus sp. TaxID=1271 RepID=UPI002A9148D2|nr:hypothetical protein [Micrococcus sp.]MDY6054684.1 hypothetical protein [Micrococcus sp.]